MQSSPTQGSLNRPPDILWMDELLRQGNISLSEKSLQQLWSYHQLLRSHNQDRDLTRITGFESMVVKHYIDCLLVGNLLELSGPLLDIGTGAGFPGIPLKIAFPQLDIILAEHRPKRVAFLKKAIQTLNLQKIGIFSKKVIPESFHTPVTMVISRALEDIGKTLQRIEPFLQAQGKVIFMKGPSVDTEIEFLHEHPEQFNGYRLAEDLSYDLPIIGHNRRLVVYEKMILEEVE